MSMNPNASWGRAMLDSVANIVPTFGNIHVVYSSSDASDTRIAYMQEVFKPFAGLVRIWSSLEDAYDAVISNNNDVIVLDADSTHSLDAGLLVSKNRVNFIGLGPKRLVQQGAKVQVGGAIDSAYVLKNTGVCNSFTNIKFIMGSTHANALTVLQDGGEGALFDHCSFVLGVVNNLDETTAHEVVAGSDSANFIDCTFGADTLLTSAARSVFHIDQVTASQEFKSNILRRCNFIISSSSSTAEFVRMDSNADVLFTNLFEDCTFQASIDSAGGAALARAVSTANGLVKGTLNFANPKAFGVTNFGTNGTNNDGLWVVGPLAVNTDLVAVQPIAT